jgi:hypothetical protein
MLLYPLSRRLTFNKTRKKKEETKKGSEKGKSELQRKQSKRIISTKGGCGKQCQMFQKNTEN